MATIQENNEKYAEYYFDYRIIKVEGKNDIKTPKIYIERDFSMADLNYSVFTVPEEWVGKKNIERIMEIRNDDQKTKLILDELPYDTVKLVFDIKGIWCDDLSNEQSEIYKKAEIHDVITFTSFYSKRCRVVIDNKNTKDHSGTGMIDMYKNNELVARFYFAINFTFRKKIFYSINVANKKLEAKFRCNDKPQNIAVQFFYKEGRIPCLKDDVSVNSSMNSVGGYNINFTNSSINVMNPPISLKPEEASKNNVYGVKFQNPDLEKYYILECESNNTISLESKVTNIVSTYTCPFCHKEIDREIVKKPGYLSGGTPCHIGVNDKLEYFPKILDKSGNGVKNAIYCYEDLIEEQGKELKGRAIFKGNFLRLLPPNYMNHDSFKITFSGATRSGKTTFISRFFDLSGTSDNSVSMPMTSLVNSLNNLNITLKTPAITLLRRDKEVYRTTDSDWTNDNDRYVERKISLIPEKYPMPTPNDSDFTKYPFIAEVNNKTYISFYDIAGEDAQHTRMLQNITGGQDSKEITGIFYLINGNINAKANEEVVNRLITSFNENCPVAVILTKMDLIEDQFDSNAHCLRTDYITQEKKYDGSVIEREINYSSEEIKAYLAQNNLLPNFNGKFKNVKYFGVSAFNFFDSFHDITDSPDNPGHVKFECSSKRMELPFVWMLRQFNVIN